MAELEGASRLRDKLAKLATRFGFKDDRPAVVVGYSQAYALWVHENLEAVHKVGQAKFLEEPFRRMRDELGGLIRADLRRGLTIQQALLRAGLYLQRESQRLCPVDTGALRASAFTRLEGGK